MIYSLAFVITGDYGDGKVVANTSSIKLEASTTHDNEKSEKSCEPDKRDGGIVEIKLELEDDSSLWARPGSRDNFYQIIKL